MRHTTDSKAWPCKYDGYPDMCKNRNAAHALSDMKCDDVSSSLIFLINVILSKNQICGIVIYISSSLRNST